MRLVLFVVSITYGCEGSNAGAEARVAPLGSPPSFPDTGRFECEGTRCVQYHPRVPDTGEWTCMQQAGVVVCSGGEPAAGVVARSADARWTCSGRRGHPGERVCVDLTPDFPDARRVRCHYVAEPRIARVCELTETEPQVGDSCEAGSRSCLEGLACVDGRCELPIARAECWLDGDCGAAACRFGACLELGR